MRRGLPRGLGATWRAGCVVAGPTKVFFFGWEEVMVRTIVINIEHFMRSDSQQKIFLFGGDGCYTAFLQIGSFQKEVCTGLLDVFVKMF